MDEKFAQGCNFIATWTKGELVTDGITVATPTSFLITTFSHIISYFYLHIGCMEYKLAVVKKIPFIRRPRLLHCPGVKRRTIV